LPPEHVAIDVAVAVATYLSAAGQSLTAVTADDVLHWGQQWRQISSKLGLLSEEGGCEGGSLAEAVAKDAARLGQFCEELLPDACNKVDGLAALKLLKDLNMVKASLDERVAAAMRTAPQSFEDWQPSSLARLQQMRGTQGVPFSAGLLGRIWARRLQKVAVIRVSSMTSLHEECIQTLLRRSQFCSPIFALVGDVGPDPTWSFRQAADCKCAVPWSERSRWERYPHVEYQLPPPTSPWASARLEEQQCVGWVLSAGAMGTPASGSSLPVAAHRPEIAGLREPIQEFGEEGAEADALKDVGVEVLQAAPTTDEDDAEPMGIQSVDGGVSGACVSDDEDVVSWTSGDDDDDDMMHETSQDDGEVAGSDDSQAADPVEPERADSGESDANDQSGKEDRKREIKAELRALLLEGCATPPRCQRPTQVATWSDEKQSRPERAGCEIPPISNASKVVEASLQSAPASGSAALDVPRQDQLANEPLLAEVVEEASVVKIDGQYPPRIVQIGTNHDLQEVIRQLDKARWVAKQQKLGRYRHLFEPLGGVPPGGYPDHYYPGLHRLPLPGLRDSICYSYSSGHIEACLIKRGDPEGSDGEPSSSSSYWEGDGDFIADEASALRRELQEFSDDSSLSPELDVDPSELDG